MSKVQTLRGFINQRLSAAAEEIFDLFERTIAEYEEQLCRSKEENERQQNLLDTVFSPEVRLHRADVQQLLVSTENIPCEQKERGLSLDQEDSPDPPHIKEEKEELWSYQETEQLHGLKEEETTEFSWTPVPAKHEEEGEEPLPLQLGENQTEAMLHSESETDDSSYYLEESGKPWSGLIHFNDMECNAEETPVSFSKCATSSGQKEPEHDATKIQKDKKTFCCSVFQKELLRKYVLVRHMSIHTEKESFSCSVCGKCFRKKSNFSKHQETHTGNIQHLSGFNPLQNKETPVRDVKHDTEKNLEVSSECASSSDQKKKLQKPKEIQKDKPFDCSVCERRFTSKDILTRHMSCHSSEKPFGCSVCGKTFVQRSYLKDHMVSHSGEKPYGCSQCDKRFLKPSGLREHVAIHTGEKPFSCNVCDKRFFQKRYLKDHMFCHSKEKPHSCSQCGKRFLKPSRLKDHAAIHTGEKPYRCNVCDKSYTRPDILKKHSCDAESSRNKLH